MSCVFKYCISVDVYWIIKPDLFYNGGRRIMYPTVVCTVHIQLDEILREYIYIIDVYGIFSLRRMSFYA